MQSAACGLKFCGTWVQVACVILAHAASRMMFHGYFKSTCTKQYTTMLFQKLRIHLPADSYYMIVALVVNIVKAMFKWIFLQLIVTIFKFNSTHTAKIKH